MEEYEKEDFSVDESLADCLEELSNLTPGTEEYNSVSKEVERLAKVITERAKVDNDYEAKIYQIDQDAKMQEKKLKEEMKLQREKLEQEAEIEREQIAQKQAELEQKQAEEKSEKIWKGITVGGSILVAAIPVIVTAVSKRKSDIRFIQANEQLTTKLLEYEDKGIINRTSIKPKSNLLDNIKK